MNKTIVFDFDKTLTYKDSLQELFLQEMCGIKYPLRVYYMFLAVLSKFKIITVKKEKELMIKLLFQSNESLFAKSCQEQAKCLKLNPVFNKVREHIDDGDRVIILSASSEYLLKEIFKEIDVEIIGTTFSSVNGEIKCINQHPFSNEKHDLLIKYRITTVDEMFYDSHNDECLIPLCHKWNKVKDGVVIQTKERKR